MEAFVPALLKFLVVAILVGLGVLVENKVTTIDCNPEVTLDCKVSHTSGS